MNVLDSIESKYSTKEDNRRKSEPALDEQVEHYHIIVVRLRRKILTNGSMPLDHTLLLE